jgi:DNA-3-methyladenine glycosylase
MGILPRSFYARPAAEVARALLGQVLTHRERSGRIVEVEAYLGREDGAAHASRGITPRTEVIYGPPGHAYVYLIYGMYHCLNLIAEPDGKPGCVLIRALEPLAGIEGSCSGPGRLTRALGITLEQNRRDVTRGDLTVRRASWAGEMGVGPRIGIRHCRDWPLRFWIRGNRWVSR